MTLFRTLDDVAAANKAIGHHWFEPSTMLFFDSKVETGLLYAGTPHQSFVYSNHFHPSDPAEQAAYPRHYKLAFVSPEGKINHVPYGSLLTQSMVEYPTLEEAVAALAGLVAAFPDGWPTSS